MTDVPFHEPPVTTGVVPRSPDPAVPPLVAFTVSELVVEPLRVKVTTTGDPPSAPPVAVTVTVGGTAKSLSTIVTMPIPSAITEPPVELESVTLNVSLPSTSTSPIDRTR